MAFFKRDDLSLDNMYITVDGGGETKYLSSKNFVCVEDPNINGSNIKEYIFKEILKYKDCNTFSEFQRTPFGFCGIVTFYDYNNLGIVR